VSVDTTNDFATPAELEAKRSKALIVGIAGLVICAAGFVLSPGNFYRSWLTAYMLFLGISLGSLALIMIQHLSGGGWGIYRRIFEASAKSVYLLVPLFLPVVLGMSTLYVWTHEEHVAADEILRHKEPYLNTPFFLVRAVIYFVSWAGLAYFLTRLSARQDEGEVAVNSTLQRVSGAGLVIYAITITFAGIDWIMSINPHWFSTLFGFLMMGGQGLSALAFTIIVATFLLKHGALEGLLKPYHFHDLGKLMFAFVMLWAYFNFSQYLLTYAANLIEEIPYYITRTSHGWQYLALFLVAFHFAVPWLLLLSRDRKRNPYRLIWVAAWLLLMRYADLFMMIAPEFAPAGENMHMLTGEHASHFYLHWTDIGAPLAIGGLWLWMFFTNLSQRPLFAMRDPFLREALESGGGH